MLCLDVLLFDSNCVVVKKKEKHVLECFSNGNIGVPRTKHPTGETRCKKRICTTVYAQHDCLLILLYVFTFVNDFVQHYCHRMTLFDRNASRYI